MNQIGSEQEATTKLQIVPFFVIQIVLGKETFVHKEGSITAVWKVYWNMFSLTYAVKYSRMDQVKLLEDSL